MSDNEYVKRGDLAEWLRSVARRQDLFADSEDRITSEINLAISGALEQIAEAVERGFAS